MCVICTGQICGATGACHTAAVSAATYAYHYLLMGAAVFFGSISARKKLEKIQKRNQ